MSGDDGKQRDFKKVTPDTGVATHVDIKSLEDVVPRLESLKKYIQDHLIPAVGAMKLSTNMGQTYFGKPDSARDVWETKHNGYVTMANKSYSDIAHALDVAAEATKSIVQNYKDAEHNNALDVAAVDKAFADQSKNGSV